MPPKKSVPETPRQKLLRAKRLLGVQRSKLTSVLYSIKNLPMNIQRRLVNTVKNDPKFKRLF